MNNSSDKASVKPGGVVRPGGAGLTTLLAYQHGIISREQALDSGMSQHAISSRIRAGGRWQRLLPSVYLTMTGTPTRDQRDTAALLYGGPGSTLTCSAALRRHGLRAPAAGHVDVLIPAGRRRGSVEYVVMHRTWRLPALVCYQGPVQFALPARAVADAVRGLDGLVEVRAVVAEAVQSRRCTVEQLAEELECGPIRGSALFRAALADVMHGVRSAPEGDLLDLLKRGGLPMPLLNAKLLCGDEFVAQPDAWWPDAGVVVEVDSKEWHLSPEDWERTMRRHARMTALGILVLHFTPRQIRQEPEQVLATIRAALDVRRGQAERPLVRTVAGSAPQPLQRLTASRQRW